MSASILRMGSAGWVVQCHDHVESTNHLARSLPSWNAVMARSQSGGRGRYGRKFESGEGGLWITAVVPSSPPAARWIGFSLVVGLHLLRMLEHLGVHNARLRWPNDMMVNDQKLAGLLIEQSAQGALTVGLGVNITNKPWQANPLLAGMACELSMFLDPHPSPEELAANVLDAISEAHATMEINGLAPAIDSLNGLWKLCAVTVRLHGGGEQSGVFQGLDPAGNLLIQNPMGQQLVIPHQNVLQLLENP